MNLNFNITQFIQKHLSWILLCGLIISKTAIYAAILPVWHGPDEQIHFSQVAFYAEMGRFQEKSESDVNMEIVASTYLLGTLRDARGNNSFTFHPKFRIHYTDSTIGTYELNIAQQAQSENRKIMVGTDASHNPPLYYQLASIIYNIAYQTDIFTRIYAVRLLSILLSLMTLYVSYLIAKELFTQKFKHITLVTLVAMHPMFSFVSVSVNNDNLFILMTSIFILLNIQIIKNKLSIKHALLLVITFYLGSLTKPQWFIWIPIQISTFYLLLIRFLNSYTYKKTTIFLHLISVSIIALTLYYIDFFLGVAPETHANPHLPAYTLLEHGQFVLHHTYREVLPWYWGVFNWLGVVLPRWVNRIQMLIILFSGIGFLLWAVKQLYSKNYNRHNQANIFCLASGIIYFISLELWEYLFIKSIGYQYGIQGRYFLPTVISHMVFILLGISHLPFFNSKIINHILTLWWTMLGTIGVYTIASSYYQIIPLSTFINQSSQYKPWIIKGVNMQIIVLIYVISLIIFTSHTIIKLITSPTSKSTL